MMQLLYESTILDYKLHINTYIRLIISLYFDYEVAFDRKDFIMHLYILFSNDTSSDTFRFCTQMLQEYTDTHFLEAKNADLNH